MASFLKFLPILQNVEGGYQALSKDTGNYNSLGQLVGTNWGISAKTYELWIKRPPSVSDMKNMPKATATEIYRQWYWNAMKGDSINNQSVADTLIDHGVNAGIGTAGKMVQTILKTKFNKSVSVDGVIGNQTISAINSVNQEQLHSQIMTARKNYYYSLGSTFLKSWLNRLKSFFFTQQPQQ